MRRSDLPVAAAGLVVALAYLFVLPASFWDAHEVRFAQALLTFDPVHLQPEPPGYPLFVGIARLLNFFGRSPFVVLCALSVVASVIGALLLARTAALFLGSEWLGAAAAVIFYLSPAMLVFAPLPNAEATSIAFVIAGFYAFATQRPIMFAAVSAAAIGCRPQLAAAMIAVFLYGWLKLPRRRDALIVFLFVLFVSFVPLVEAGGLKLVWQRSGTLREIIMRFVAHPWGSKAISLPLLGIAAIGLYRIRSAFIVALFGAVHFAFAIFTGTLDEGVQPILPALITVAVFAAAAFSRLPIISGLAAIAFSVASFLYAAPILLSRRQIASPPVRAAMSIPSKTVVLSDPDLAAHAAYEGHEVWNFSRFDDYAEQPVDVMLFVEGESKAAGATTFSWVDSDAYGKLTTERFRIVSLVPLPRENRYRGRVGVYPMENAPERGEWRWLAKDAVIEPQAPDGRVVLRLALPDNAPIEANELSVNGERVVLRRGEAAIATIPASPRITIRSARSFVAPDGRELAVQLLSLSSARDRS